MNKDDLKKLGLTDDALIDQIIVLHGKDIEGHKSKLSTATTEADALKKQLSEAGATIEGFKKLDVEAIKAAADEWKTKAEKATADAESQVAKVKFDYALDGALNSAKVKDTVSVRAHLKTDALKLTDDGSILGLKEQLEALKTSKDFLFEADQPTPKITTGGNNQTVVGDPVVSAFRKAAGLT